MLKLGDLKSNSLLPSVKADGSLSEIGRVFIYFVSVADAGPAPRPTAVIINFVVEWVSIDATYSFN